MPIQEIFIGQKEEFQNHDKRFAGIVDQQSVKTFSVIRLEGVTAAQAEIIRVQALTDPVVDISFTKLPSDQSVYTIEISHKPGVMAPQEESLFRIARLLGIDPLAVGTSKLYRFSRQIDQQQIVILKELLPSQVEEVVRTPPDTLLVGSEAYPTVSIKISDLEGDDLSELSKQRRLFLNLEEMQVIQGFYRSIGREPTDIELETLAQTWSEHNGHKTFKALLVEPDGTEKSPLIKRIKSVSQRYFEKVGIVSAFADNSGVIALGDGEYGIAIKGETHNSPVAIEPFGGAATKVGGVIRDIVGTGKGGENVMSLMFNCFAYPDIDEENIPSGCLHPRHLLLENSRGERDYGNKMGIPTLSTNIIFHNDFRAKPTSMGIAIGLIPLEHTQKGEPQSGDLILSLGGRTGRDGIHGATFSSGEMTSDTRRIDGTSVQIGNPIEQKRMFDAISECRDNGLIRAMTDCGGGGYSSAIGEIGADIGVEIDLDLVPLKYKGLSAWEIWLSESQERMIVAIDPSKVDEFRRICEKHEVPVDAIGRFTGDNKLSIKASGNLVCDLPMAFLHDGLPQRKMRILYEETEKKDQVPDMPTDWQSAFERVLGNYNICSKEAMLRQYDHTVQGRTVLEPFTGVHSDALNDAAIVQAMYDKNYGVVAASGANPLLNKYDPYWGSIWAVARAVSNFTAHGGDYKRAGLIDNFVWPFPDEKSLADLDRSVDGLCDAMEVLELPCISGKDSLSSTYRAGSEVIKIPPVLTITACGPIKDIEKTVSVDIKNSEGSVICLVGNMDFENMGGSVYFETENVENSNIPHVDIKSLPKTLSLIHSAIKSDKVLSCKSVGQGGIAAALSIMCFGGDCGADIDMSSIGVREDFVLFNETAGCFLVEVKSEQEAKSLFGESYVLIGYTKLEKTISLGKNSSDLASIDLDKLKAVWKLPFEKIYAN